MADEKKIDQFALEAGVPNIEGEMRPKPKLADRLSWRIGAAVAVFLGVVVFVFMWAMSGVGEKKAPVPGAASSEKKEALAGSVVPKDLQATASVDGAGAGGLTEDRVAGSLVGRVDNAIAFGGASAPAAAGKGGIPGNDWSKSGATVGAIPQASGQIPMAAAGTSGAALTPKQQAAEQRRVEKERAIDQQNTERMARQTQARTGGMSAKTFDEGSGSGSAAGGPADMMKSVLKLAQDAQKGGGDAAGGVMGGAPGKAGDGEQDEKLTFLKSAGKEEPGYHPHISIPALSKNEVKVGTFIPLVLETGINSDLPGQIAARTTEDVYDSITGCRLLIPAMTKVIGRYDSKVALGQGRILVVWNSAIFSDGAELNLAGMQGYDSAGQSGFTSEVDNHYLRLFGLAFGMSMVTAGVQLSVPPPPMQGAGGAAVTPQQTVSTALAQQFGQLGATILGKYMNVQPTLRNYPGERFTILVPRTIVFVKVWRNRCEAAKR